MKHLYINGFMGVGKSTFAKKVARTLNMPFIDIDALIEKQNETSIQDIFETKGEGAFRKMEAEKLREIKDEKPSVIATGGGLPCYFDNMNFMNEHGFTVYLKATPAFIYSRLVSATKPRPLLKNLSGEGLLVYINNKISEREPFYLMSHVVFDVPVKSPETLVNSVVSVYGQFVLKD